MMGFLIDENEFEVSPAVNRVLQILEVDERKVKKQKKFDYVPSKYNLDLIVKIGSNMVMQKIEYTADITVDDIENIVSYDVYINNDFYGTDLTSIQINTNDTLKFIVEKDNPSLESKIVLNSTLI
jgi:hypothetical protein